MKSKTTQTLKNTSKKPGDQAQIERVKLDLLSLVSHELRTPLTSVLNSIRMLREEDLSVAERMKFLDMAHRNAEKLNATLGQLLDLSKLVSGRLVCRFHEVSLKHLVSGQIENLTGEAELLGYTVQVAGRPDDLPVILGDAPRLEQVLSSLFENALKFSPNGSKITFKMKPGVKASGLPEGLPVDRKIKHEFVLFEISNPIKKGSMPPDHNVFTIFSQQESVLNRSHEGVGGSLAIGSEVLRQHGGALFATADDHHFTIYMALPILESEQALLKVLESRLYALKTEVGALSLLILEVNSRSLKQVHEALKSALFRASDTVYSLPEFGQVAVLMDDCKKADAPKIVRRLLENLGAEAGKFLKPAKVGLASCPEDGTEPDKILACARKSFVPLAEF